ncbi:transmembrane protein 26-like [Babylonia areolata]|uniref:transmembrane protein 26-like n=1 Tax=Babylonia areolata TaxID=304850 RepID=UPI003FD1E4F4
MAAFNRVKAFVVRWFLCLHFVLVVWRVTASWSQDYWLLATAILPFLLEGAYTIVKRAGMEWRQFSLCFFFYLCATLPGIWLLEIKKTMTYQNQNYTQVEDIVVSGVEIPIRLSPNTWVLVVEEMMLYLMILGRWLLPRGGVGREQLTQLLFGFVGIASDIMELFSLFDEDPGIRHNTLMAYAILAVWSLSTFQFTLTFATAHRPRRARGLRLSVVDPDRSHRVSVLRVELVATVLSMLMQDGPFLTLRLYTIITYNVITYSLVFFTAKNVLVILLLLYKIFLLMGKLCCPKSGDDDDGG